MFAGSFPSIQADPAVHAVIPPSVLEGGDTAPEFPKGLPWLNTDQPLSLKQLRGKFVILDFWTLGCINCMHVIPELERLQTKYGNALVIIGVHSAKFQNEKDTLQIRDAILRYGVHHPVVNDANFRIWNSYAIQAWPTLVLINPKGRIVGRIAGEDIYEAFDTVLRQGIPYFTSKNELDNNPFHPVLEESKQAGEVLSFPGKIFADKEHHRLVVSDSDHNRVLILDPAGKILDVIGSGSEGAHDGGFDDATFLHPQGTFLDGATLYIADTENHLIRAADLKTRTVTTVLGTGQKSRKMNVAGQGRNVALDSPWDVLVHDGKLYIAMAGAHQIWVADLKTWEAHPFIGSAREGLVDGHLHSAELAQTSGLATDGETLYFADPESSSIRKAPFDPDGKVSTIVGRGLFEFGDVDGSGGKVRIQHALSVAFHDGLLYVTDTYNSKIKVIDPAHKSSTTYAGNGSKALADGSFEAASFNAPGGLAWLDGKLYVADTNNNAIRVLDPTRKTVNTLTIAGLDVLARSERDAGFHGRIENLGEQRVKPDGAELRIDFQLPAGYKFNRDAPFYLRWHAENPSALIFQLKPEQADVKHLHFPFAVPIEKLSGPTVAQIDTEVYYCAEPATACYVDPIRARVTLIPTQDGVTSAPVNITVRTPHVATGSLVH